MSIRHEHCHNQMPTNLHRTMTSTTMNLNQALFLKAFHAFMLVSLPACTGTNAVGTGGSSGLGGANAAGATASGGRTGTSTGGRLAIGGTSSSTNGGSGGTNVVGSGGGIPCGPNTCNALTQHCCDPNCGICGPASGQCPAVACATGGASNGSGTVGQNCALTSDCVSGLTCCYPCGIPGCTNRCAQLGPNGVCPAYP